MKLRTALVAAATTLVLVVTTGCAVTRDQETVGAYIDDSVITTTVKSRFFDDKSVDGSAVSVETLHGTVMLSGFAKTRRKRKPPRALLGKLKA